MAQALKQYFVLTKGGIGIFVLIGGLVGYALGYDMGQPFSVLNFLLFLFGLYSLSAGSFALNQAQEYKIDQKMKRTETRPVASGWISVKDTYFLSVMLIGIGTSLLWLASPLAGLLGFMTIVLYNGFYTMIWKKWAFGAVPGAIPGAMPVVIGYGAINENIFSVDCLYLFLVMFLWQMPHFWSIAIKCKEDYKRGGLPVLPTVVGDERTVFHMGLYTFVYAALAMVSPWFVEARYVYIFLVVPVVLKLMWEFVRYIKAADQSRWLPFFLWVNLSVIVFLVAPVVDKYIFLYQTL